MSDDQTARLGLPYLAAGQMQKHVTLNEALTRLDAVVQTAIVSRTEAPGRRTEPCTFCLKTRPAPSGTGSRKGPSCAPRAAAGASLRRRTG